jgi:hypothetical protein
MKKILLIASFAFATAPIFGQGFWAPSTTVTTSTTGMVGIGTTTPTAKLDIISTVTTGAPSGLPVGKALVIQNTDGDYQNAPIVEVWNRPTTVPTSPYTLKFWVTPSGSVGISNNLRIGTTAANGVYSNYKLSVDGDMIAKRCVIQVSDWADYVFDDDYSLPSLNEVEAFVNENKHLPGVPDACEVADKGIEVGEMNKILLQKVEELTLYMIQLKKQNDQLQSQIDDLKK